MNKKQEERLKSIPVSMHGVFKKAYSGKSRSSGIKAKYYDCACYLREEAHLCTV
jgi:hypothetical protein